jgi:extracellular elastinolytic metalloproteinase
MSSLPHGRPTRRRARRLAAVVGAGAVVVTTAMASASLASAQSAERVIKPSTSERTTTVQSGEARGHYDARYGRSSSARAITYRSASRAAERGPTAAFQRSLPGKAVFDIDGVTGTVRILSRLDGFLTGTSKLPAKKIALKYVRSNHAALGLTSADMKTFKLKREYVDITGVHHLYWIQRIGGQTVFGNGLTAAVTKDGHLLEVGGSPVSKAHLPAPQRPEIDSRTAAVADARARLGASTDSRAGRYDSAQKVLFVTARGTYIGWATTVMSVAQPATQVVDAASGRLLYRNPLGNDESGEATGEVFRNYPGAERGGDYVPVNFSAKGWLPSGATRLQGNNAHAYSDVNDDNQANASEEVHPGPGGFDNHLVPFQVKGMSFCKDFPCSWDPNKAFSWKTNRAQNATQVFYYVNTMHDHLLAKPVGFTEAAGNFEAKNATGKGKGHDAVETQTMDGASINHGLPDGAHVDNANMNTPPDGTPPTMQMYLQHEPGTSYPAGDAFPANNTGDEANTVYHEYTHGLSNRLVVDVSGNSTLGLVQGGAMGEAWSDWFAIDELVDQGLEIDKKGKADLDIYVYDGAGGALVRTEGIDCTPSSPKSRCPGGLSGSTGYTYDDYGDIIGMPEVHADGEIWGQTLWSLRDKIGSKATEGLVTRAMELSPANPSYLDVRNALLLADMAQNHGKFSQKIWNTFASRGMGFFAGSLGGDDAQPAASFKTPPKKLGKGLLTGTVTDSATGQPVAGVPVTLAFQGLGVANPTAVTAADGTYKLGPVPAGKYGKLLVSGAGYDSISRAVKVTSSGTSSNFSVRRDWAAVSGGAKVLDFNGPDYTDFGCGPSQALDTSLATGWGSTTGSKKGAPTNTFVPKFLTVDLGHKVNITTFGVDPSATCGDAGSASTGKYQIETSPDNVTWTVASSGEFTVANRGQLNTVTPTQGTAGVQYVRFTILGNQVPDFATSCPLGAFDGCQFTDLTELEVYGVPAP